MDIYNTYRPLFDNAATRRRRRRRGEGVVGVHVLSCKRSAIAVCPPACIKVGRHTQCERGFTLQTD